MCCCGKPVVNGELGYKWQPNDTPSVRQPHPPAAAEGDKILIDAPGRCGGLDSHSHHFRVVKRRSFHYLLVRHGGGDEHIQLSCPADLALPALMALDPAALYWTLHTLYSAHADAASAAQGRERGRWQQAAAEKRIKTRKRRGANMVTVWIEEKPEAKPQ